MLTPEANIPALPQSSRQPGTRTTLSAEVSRHEHGSKLALTGVRRHVVYFFLGSAAAGLDNEANIFTIVNTEQVGFSTMQGTHQPVSRGSLIQ